MIPVSFHADDAAKPIYMPEMEKGSFQKNFFTKYKKIAGACHITKIDLYNGE